jgi:FixJ family two-component response regulator
MSISEEKPAIELNRRITRPNRYRRACSHEGEDGMGLRSMTVGRYEEIRRRLAEGRGVREIARALGCSRDTVREVRDGGSRPMHPSQLPIRCGCCNWTGRRSFTIWVWVIR